MCAVLVVDDVYTRPDKGTGLRGASLVVRRGELFGMIGPDGSGKTAALECAQGLRVAESGSISVLGLDPATDREAVSKVLGSQRQASSLPERMRVWEIVELFAAMRDEPIDQGTLLERWGLLGRRNTMFRALAAEDQVRLFVMLAVMHDPDMVFFDELTTGLDPKTRAVAWRLIEAVHASGITVVVTTVHADEAERCDRVAVFSAGSVAAVDSPNALIRRHAGGVRFRFVRPWVETDWIQIVPGVGTYAANGRTVEVRGTADSLPRVCAGLVGRGAVPEGLRVEQGGLAAVVDSLTTAGVGA